MASAAALLDFMTLNRAETKVVDRFGTLGKIVEVGAMVAMEREATRVARVGLPFKTGRAALLWHAAKGFSAAGLVISLLPGHSRFKRMLGALLTTIGALNIRFALLEAGKASARDPRATFYQQRAGQGAAEVTDKGRVTGV